MLSSVTRNWNTHAASKSIMMECGVEYRDADKMAPIPTKNVTTKREALPHKPEWIGVKLPADSTRIQGVKTTMCRNGLHSVYEEASCSNLVGCFNHGTAASMALGAICIRRCPFCDVAYGCLAAPDANEPVKLTQIIVDMALCYVVIISIDRGDLRDDGTQHFTDCIIAIREKSPQIKTKALVPNFRGRTDRALDILTAMPPDVLNHNLESVSCIYRQVWPGADYNWSPKLLERFEGAHPEIPAESGLMMGLGETSEEIIETVSHTHFRAHETLPVL